MIGYLNGQLTFKSPTTIYVDVNGVGYHVNISLHTFQKIEHLEKAKIFIHHHITESDQSLFGFFDEQERSIFKHLISVSGVGPSTARVATSYMEPSALKQAIVQGNVQMVSKIKGIGPKTAQRIILDLKDKLFKEMDGDVVVFDQKDASIKEEALSALSSLGFQKSKISKTVDMIIAENDQELTVESLIKSVLRQLS